jgi:hypothetical protein
VVTNMNARMKHRTDPNQNAPSIAGEQRDITGVVRELRLLPLVSYRYTCPKCGCHVASTVMSGPVWASGAMTICSYCCHVYDESD